MVTFLSASSLPLANIIYSFNESNPAGKVSVLALFVGSIYTWTVMLTKRGELVRAKRDSRHFLTSFRNESNPLALFLKRREFRFSPLYRVYEQSCKALGAELDPVRSGSDELFSGSMTSDDLRLSHIQLEGVRNTSERTVADQALLLEGRMGILATAVTASPFLGLLGTVWGVMESFGAMAKTGSVQLSAVAPGIAGALLTTVIGLLVALPSAIGYNLLTTRVRELHVQTDNFAQELIAEVQRFYLEESR